MLDRFLMRRPGSAYWQLRVPVPSDVQKAFGRKEFTKSLQERDRAKAAERALPFLAALYAEWDKIRRQTVALSAGTPFTTITEADLLEMSLKLYGETRAIAGQTRMDRYIDDPAGSGAGIADREKALTSFKREVANGDLARWVSVTERGLEKRGQVLDPNDETFKDATRMFAEVTLAALDVEHRIDRGELAPKPVSDVLDRAQVHTVAQAGEPVDISYFTLVDAFMRMWMADRTGKKESNTEQQKRATFKLFGEFWEDKPIRGIKPKDAAEFFDHLKLLDANWARSPRLRELHWTALLETCGDQENGLAASTMNRHMRTLKSLWEWAEQRDHCGGRNPFKDFNTRIKLGENSYPYRAWENDELKVLFSPPPNRSDVTEIMIVAMFTGMRLDEIASLTWGRVRQQVEDDEAITYFHIDDAKTPAGIRDVPVHPALSWLLHRPRGETNARIWPKFNLESVGKKAGADAGREFSRFKLKRGFKNREKTFHSFRKNVTRIIERAGVLENEWAQVFGHERGFTYARYNPDGITLRRKAEIIRIIDFPGVEIPHPLQ